MKSFFRTRKGYTLIELLVVVAIMAITAGTLISFSKIGQDQTTLYIEASKIIDVALRAKALAISAYKDPNDTRISCAHGITLDLRPGENSFSLTRYLRKSPTDEACATMGNSNLLSLGDRFERAVAESSTYVLSKGIVFDLASTTISDIAFRPPDPQIFFFDKSGMLPAPPLRSGTIVIMDENGQSRIQIVIGQGGQITYNFIN